LTARHHRPPVGDNWYLDKVVISIRGKNYWLWYAVDQNGNALEILVQSRRNTQEAKRFMRKLMKQYGVPRVMVTDSVHSFGAAKRAPAPNPIAAPDQMLSPSGTISHAKSLPDESTEFESLKLRSTI